MTGQHDTAVKLSTVPKSVLAVGFFVNLHAPLISLRCPRQHRSTQSIQFLVAVKEYKEIVRAPGEADPTKPFAKLIGIIDKFVRDRSPFEVNLGSSTKTAVVKMADAATFRELSLVSCHSVECRDTLEARGEYDARAFAPEVFVADVQPPPDQLILGCDTKNPKRAQVNGESWTSSFSNRFRAMILTNCAPTAAVHRTPPQTCPLA